MMNELFKEYCIASKCSKFDVRISETISYISADTMGQKILWGYLLYKRPLSGTKYNIMENSEYRLPVTMGILTSHLMRVAREFPLLKMHINSLSSARHHLKSSWNINKRNSVIDQTNTLLYAVCNLLNQ